MVFYSPEIQRGIVDTANRLGMKPLDLATIISYETGGTFNPTQAGPTTKWGQHRGLIQFGEPQARQHGVNWDDPVNSQLGPGGAVENYFLSSGWKPGMGILDAYSIVNAGGPGRYNASDTAAGGAPGTVRDKVMDQFGPHRAKAAALLGMTPEEMDAMGPITASSRGGGGGRRSAFDFMQGEPDEYGAFAVEDLPPPTMRDRIAAGLVGAGDVLGALGAGHATNFAATDAFLAGQQERRALKVGREMTSQNTNQTIGWLERQGYTDLADLVRSGGDAKDVTNEALARRKAEMEAAAEGGGSPLPEGMDKELYKTGSNLGQLNRNMQSLEGILIQMDEAMAAGDTDKFRALKEAAQAIENDFKSGWGNYQSFGNEPNDAILEQGGIGIPQDLVSEKELNEIIEKHGDNFAAMSVALVQKYPDLAPFLGSMAGMSAGSGGGTAGVVTQVGGGLAGGGAGLWLRNFLQGEGSDTAAAKFNRLRIDQAKLRLGITGRRIQNEMRTVQEQYRGGTGQDFSVPFGEGWDTRVWGANDPSDPDGWN